MKSVSISTIVAVWFMICFGGTPVTQSLKFKNPFKKSAHSFERQNKPTDKEDQATNGLLLPRSIDPNRIRRLPFKSAEKPRTEQQDVKTAEIVNTENIMFMALKYRQHKYVPNWSRDEDEIRIDSTITATLKKNKDRITSKHTAYECAILRHPASMDSRVALVECDHSGKKKNVEDLMKNGNYKGQRFDYIKKDKLTRVVFDIHEREKHVSNKCCFFFMSGGGEGGDIQKGDVPNSDADAWTFTHNADFVDVKTEVQQASQDADAELEPAYTNRSLRYANPEVAAITLPMDQKSSVHFGLGFKVTAGSFTLDDAKPYMQNVIFPDLDQKPLYIQKMIQRQEQMKYSYVCGVNRLNKLWQVTRVSLVVCEAPLKTLKKLVKHEWAGENAGLYGMIENSPQGTVCCQFRIVEVEDIEKSEERTKERTKERPLELEAIVQVY